jgi:hypothetical protein
VAAEIDARPGVDQGIHRKRNPVARTPSSFRKRGASRSRTEGRSFSPENRESTDRKAGPAPGFTSSPTKRKPKRASQLPAPVREPEGGSSQKSSRPYGCSPHPSGRQVPKHPTAPTACRGPGSSRPIRHRWLQRPGFRARAAALPIASVLHGTTERPVSTQHPRKGANSVRGTRKLPNARLIPSIRDQRMARSPGQTEPRAPEAACRPGRAGSLRLPTGNLLEVSNAQSRSRAAGVMATSDRRGLTPSPFQPVADARIRNGAETKPRPSARPSRLPLPRQREAAAAPPFPAQAERPLKARSPSRGAPQGAPRTGSVGQEELPRHGCSSERRRSAEEPNLPPRPAEAKPKEATSDSRWQHLLPQRT